VRERADRSTDTRLFVFDGSGANVLGHITGEGAMGKLKLNVDELVVMSFELVRGRPSPSGTVRGFDQIGPAVVGKPVIMNTDPDWCYDNTEPDWCYFDTEPDWCYANTEPDWCRDHTEQIGCRNHTEQIGCHTSLCVGGM